MTPAARARRQVRIPILLVSASAWVFLLSNVHVHSAITHMALMTAAMMLPPLGPPVSHVCARSFARRRRRSVFLFMFAYTGLWMIAGWALLSAAKIAHATVIAGIVVAWQSSPFKQRCLNRGHFHPTLPAFGVAADRAVLRFGATHAVWCIGSCWALMLLTLALPAARHELMAVVSFWIFTERFEPLRTPSWRPPFPATAARRALFFARRPLTAIGSL